MLSWGEFRAQAPELAQAGRDIFYQFGVGLAFLGTVRRDGGPRLHPVRVVIDGEGIYTFLIPSPKQRDLLRDARYALHTYPRPDDDDVFYVTGVAREVVDRPELRAKLERQFVGEMSIDFSIEELAGQHLFEHRVGGCLRTVTHGHGDPNPVHTVWRA